MELCPAPHLGLPHSVLVLTSHRGTGVSLREACLCALGGYLDFQINGIFWLQGHFSVLCQETLHGFGAGWPATSVVVKNASLLTSAMQEVHHVLKPQPELCVINHSRLN